MAKINFQSFYDKVTGEGLGAELPDGTIVLAKKKERTVGIAFPKNKFWNIFQKQMESDSEYLAIDFSEEEMVMILQSLTTKHDANATEDEEDKDGKRE